MVHHTHPEPLHLHHSELATPQNTVTVFAIETEKTTLHESTNKLARVLYELVKN